MIPRNHGQPFFSPEKSSLNPEKGETSSSPAVPHRLSHSKLPHVGQNFSTAKVTSEGEDEKEKRIVELTEENSALLDVLDSLNEYLDRTRKERTNDTWISGEMDNDGVRLSEYASNSSSQHLELDAAKVIRCAVSLAYCEAFRNDDAFLYTKQMPNITSLNVVSRPTCMK
jgi:hypothetical protein